MVVTQERLQIKHFTNRDRDIADGFDAIDGLKQTPKSLPPKYFYDDYGSELFEQICDLPEYYPTRTEAAILETYAREIARVTGACQLVELGSGSSTKTRHLLDAYQQLSPELDYVPIDVSGSILIESAQQLLKDYPSLNIQGLVGTYEQALEDLAPTNLPARMLIFLGSTLGNMDPQECDRFLQNIASSIEIGDYFLLGIDLQKPRELLEAAYNDAQGVTARFNLNMLEHLNSRFGGNFNVEEFEHWAFYNPEKSRIEMHLRCLQSQEIRLNDLEFQTEMQAGETIRTEICRKFNLDDIKACIQENGLSPQAVWSDENQWFGLILCQKA